jgi:hypothetical protein
MPADDPGDYKVGYRRPPLETRFKKGQSGNPAGRPRPRSLVALLFRELDRRIEVKQGGKRRRVSRRALGAARLAEQFAEADRHAIRTVLNLVQELERRAPPEPDEPRSYDEADRLVIANVLARLRAP